MLVFLHMTYFQLEEYVNNLTDAVLLSRIMGFFATAIVENKHKKFYCSST